MDKIEELILKDGRFEPPELIVAVKVLHYSSQYLDDFVEQMRKDMSQACNDDTSSCPADCAYSDMEEKVAEVQKQTQEVIEDMGRKFAQKQGHHFTLLLKEELDRRSGKPSGFFTTSGLILYPRDQVRISRCPPWQIPAHFWFYSLLSLVFLCLSLLLLHVLLSSAQNFFLPAK